MRFIRGVLVVGEEDRVSRVLLKCGFLRWITEDWRDRLIRRDRNICIDFSGDSFTSAVAVTLHLRVCFHHVKGRIARFALGLYH